LLLVDQLIAAFITAAAIGWLSYLTQNWCINICLLLGLKSKKNQYHYSPCVILTHPTIENTFSIYA